MRPKGLRDYYNGSSARRPPALKPRGKRPLPLTVATMKARFLVLYARNGLLGKSCEALRWPDSRLGQGPLLSPNYVRSWAKSDPLFAAAFTAAKISFAESLEEEAHRRAVIGVRKPVYYKGEEVGATQEFSDQLLITLLKANLPDKYRERIDLSVDVHAEIRRMAAEMGVPIELAETEWRELEPLLLGKK